jgi:hypothetical protein
MANSPRFVFDESSGWLLRFAASPFPLRLRRSPCGFAVPLAASPFPLRLRHFPCGFAVPLAASPFPLRLRRSPCGFAVSLAASPFPLRLRRFPCGKALPFRHATQELRLRLLIDRRSLTFNCNRPESHRNSATSGAEPQRKQTTTGHCWRPVAFGTCSFCSKFQYPTTWAVSNLVSTHHCKGYQLQTRQAH